MASKKKIYAQGEMRPLSALAKQDGSSSRKRTAPARVPEPPKYPQYGTVNSINETESVRDINKDIYEMRRESNNTMEERIIEIPLSGKTVGSDEMPVSNPLMDLQPEPAGEEIQQEYSETAEEPEFVPEETEEPLAEQIQKPASAPEKIPVPPADKSPRPLPEYVPDAKTLPPRRRRGSEAPDLTNKAARDEFFSKYTSKPEKKPEVRFPELSEEYLREQDTAQRSGEKERSVKRTNPFLTGRTGRPVISHAKEEPESLPIGAKPAENEGSEQSDARPEMREAIEGMVQMQRKEREEALAKQHSKEERRDTKKTVALIRTAGIAGAAVIFGLIFLFGKRSELPDEDRAVAKMPEFSWNSYLKGDYTSGVSSYYNDTVPMRSFFKSAVSSMKNWKGFSSDEDENKDASEKTDVKEQKKAAFTDAGSKFTTTTTTVSYMSVVVNGTGTDSLMTSETVTVTDENLN